MRCATEQKNNTRNFKIRLLFLDKGNYEFITNIV